MTNLDPSDRCVHCGHTRRVHVSEHYACTHLGCECIGIAEYVAAERRHDAEQAILRRARIWTPEEACSRDSPFEYDQGDVVLVYYDDLYDLVKPRR